VKTLHQRATTILKVASEIVRQQEMFFLHGVKHLKPLIRRNIADEIGMHESTVSRVAANKFMATPRGLFELRYFFSAAIQAADGADSHSAEAVRSRIRELIDKEPAEAVLSDDQLVTVLKNDGVDIARRTVAKYRESLKIPSSVQRRREKSLRSA
jgi:RNA polymerase sigma-54 factor